MQEVEHRSGTRKDWAEGTDKEFKRATRGTNVFFVIRYNIRWGGGGACRVNPYVD